MLENLILIFAILIFANTTFLTVMKIRQRTMKLTRGSLLLDTSAIMDGRIVDVAKTGIISQELIIPRSVLNEMQLLADKSDSEKRTRARHGLELVREIRSLDNVSVSILQDGRVDKGGVDERLIELSLKTGASIATVDFNLNKLARTMDITVVNMNELAQVLRAKKLPGEQVEIEILQAGANRSQAVGYLEDGTMVVVEDAKENIGQKIKVEIQRSLQTEAGRMIFAKKSVQKIAKNAPQAKAFHSENIKKDASKSMKKTNSSTKKSVDQKTSRTRKNDKNQVSEIVKKTRNNNLNDQKNPRIGKVDSVNSENKNQRKTTRRKTSKSVENSMVALANKVGK